MTGAFDRPESTRNFHNLALLTLLFISLLSVPLYLALFRWSGFASKALWAITAGSLAIVLVESQYLGFLIPLVLLSIIGNLVNSGSHDLRRP